MSNDDIVDMPWWSSSGVLLLKGPGHDWPHEEGDRATSGQIGTCLSNHETRVNIKVTWHSKITELFMCGLWRLFRPRYAVEYSEDVAAYTLV